jgi:hypothetical protein
LRATDFDIARFDDPLLQRSGNFASFGRSSPLEAASI